jgi:alpha-D-xyloside xylohydrolase
VVQQGATTRTVYLPEKTSWYDFWTGKTLAGGQTVTASADIGTLPLYVRAGSIVPLGPVVQYAEAQANKPTEIRVYRGANGTFELYDDAGDGYGYENGEYATIRFDWNEQLQTLNIGPRTGAYPGLSKSRVFRVVFVDAKSGAGEAEGTGVEVTYTGTPLTVSSTKS